MRTYYVSVTSDIETGAILSCVPFAWDGPIDQLKGGEAKAAALAAQRRQEAQDRLVSEQLGMQRDILGRIAGGVGRYLTPEGEGLDPKTIAALRAQAIESAPTRFADLKRQLAINLQRRGAGGGAQPASGDYLRGLGSMNQAEEQFRAGALRDVTINDAMTRLQNRFSAANAFLGVGSQYDPSTFVRSGDAALNSRVDAAKALLEAQSGLWGSLIGAAGSVGASAIGAWGKKK